MAAREGLAIPGASRRDTGWRPATGVMTEHRWEEIKALFHQAASRPPTRAAYLEQVCAGDEALRAKSNRCWPPTATRKARPVPAAVGRALGDLWSSTDIRGADVSALLERTSVCKHHRASRRRRDG